MKKALLLTTLSAALLFSNRSEAQIPGVSKVTKALPKVDLGIKLGANFQQLSGSDDNKYNAGIVGGAFFGLHKNSIGVQIEGLVKSVKYSISTGGSDLKTVSLDVPLLFEYRIIPRIWAQAGPQFSMLLSAKSGDTDVKDLFKSSDIGAAIGLEARLPFHINAGLRYILGFADQNANKIAGASDAWKNRSIQASLGFRIL